MDHNSRWCKSGGGWGHPEILSLTSIPSNTERGNLSLTPLCGNKKKTFRSTYSFAKRKTIFEIHHWHCDTSSAILQLGDNLIFPIIPWAGLWAVLTPSLGTLIKNCVLNGPWQAARIMGRSPSKPASSSRIWPACSCLPGRYESVNDSGWHGLTHHKTLKAPRCYRITHEESFLIVC